jgi:YjbR
VVKHDRPEVPPAFVRRIRAVLGSLPECLESEAWVGVQWQVRGATVAHVFGGEDQLFRVVLRAEPDEVIAMQHLGDPYFRAGWGRNVVGMLLDDTTDWEELGELLTDSYCVQAPAELAALVPRPQQPGTSRGRGSR